MFTHGMGVLLDRPLYTQGQLDRAATERRDSLAEQVHEQARALLHWVRADGGDTPGGRLAIRLARNTQPTRNAKLGSDSVDRRTPVTTTPVPIGRLPVKALPRARTRRDHRSPFVPWSLCRSMSELDAWRRQPRNCTRTDAVWPGQRCTATDVSLGKT